MKKRMNRWTIGLIISIIFALFLSISDTIHPETGVQSRITFGDWVLLTSVISIFIFTSIAIFTAVQRRVLPPIKHRLSVPTTKSSAPSLPKRGFYLFNSREKDKAANLLAVLEVLVSSANKSVYLDSYLEDWDEAIGVLRRLVQLEGRVRFVNSAPSQDLSKLLSQEQQHLRDAISRYAEKTKSDVKNGKKFAYEFFCEEIDNARHRFDSETENYALALKKELTDYAQVANTIAEIDTMDGRDFEELCAGIFRKMGYQGVEVTRGSGDQGVDVVAERDGVRYAIQCKRYSSNLGNTPIQEVAAGKAIYGCQVGMVITNQYFTSGAQELAKANGILLRDRDWLQQKLDEYDGNLALS